MSYQPGTLYSPNYNPRVLGVSNNQQAHAIFDSKPGIGSIDLGLDSPKDALASSGRRAMGIDSPLTKKNKDVFSITSNDRDLLAYTQSSTSNLGANLYDHAMTQRMADDYGGMPIWSDAGKATYARVNNNKDTIQKPLVGTIGDTLGDWRFNEDHFRLPAKFSPASRTLRKSCKDLGQRHPNGRPFANVVLACPPQRQDGSIIPGVDAKNPSDWQSMNTPQNTNIDDEKSTNWHYSKDMNSSHGTNCVPHRSTGGHYFVNSGVTGDTIINTRTEKIMEREFYDLGLKPRTLMGGGYSRKVKAREDALIGQRGRLKKVDTKTNKQYLDIMEATKKSVGQREYNRTDNDPFNPRYEQDNSAYCTPTSEWKSEASWMNSQATERLTGARSQLEIKQIEEAKRRTTLFRRS
jgi:hypothetical protein